MKPESEKQFGNGEFNLEWTLDRLEAEGRLTGVLGAVVTAVVETGLTGLEATKWWERHAGAVGEALIRIGGSENRKESSESRFAKKIISQLCADGCLDLGGFEDDQMGEEVKISRVIGGIKRLVVGLKTFNTLLLGYTLVGDSPPEQKAEEVKTVVIGWLFYAVANLAAKQLPSDNALIMRLGMVANLTHSPVLSRETPWLSLKPPEEWDQEERSLYEKLLLKCVGKGEMKRLNKGEQKISDDGEMSRKQRYIQILWWTRRAFELARLAAIKDNGRGLSVLQIIYEDMNLLDFKGNEPRTLVDRISRQAWELNVDKVTLLETPTKEGMEQREAGWEIYVDFARNLIKEATVKAFQDEVAR